MVGQKKMMFVNVDDEKFWLERTPRASFVTETAEGWDDVEARSEGESEEGNFLIEKEMQKNGENPTLKKIQGLVTYSTEMKNVLIVSKDYTNENTQKEFEKMSKKGLIHMVYVPEGFELLDLPSVAKTLITCTLPFGVKSFDVLSEVVTKLNRILEKAVCHKPEKENTRRKVFSTLMTTQLHKDLFSILTSKVKAAQENAKTQKVRWESMFSENSDYLREETTEVENVAGKVSEMNSRCDVKHLFLGISDEVVTENGEKISVVRSWVNEIISTEKNEKKKSYKIVRKEEIETAAEKYLAY